MEPHERCWTRLPLDGAFNVRELGGYPTTNGGQTQYHRFLRSDSLSYVSERDKRFLHDYGVRAIIDLRDGHEVENAPDPSLGADVVYANIPLLGFDATQVAELEQIFADKAFSMKVVYQRILENFEGMRACVRFIADAPEGCVLFHCAVGKDRTGVLAMVLLALAGVDKWDIVANYVQTWPNLMRDEAFREQWLESSAGEFREAMESTPELIEFVYDLMEEEHGGVEGYLLECGIPDEDVAAVRRRVVGQ